MEKEENATKEAFNPTSFSEADLLDEGTSLVESQLTLRCQIRSVDEVGGIGNAFRRKQKRQLVSVLSTFLPLWLRAYSNIVNSKPKRG